MQMVARWMPEPTPLEVLIKASERAEVARPAPIAPAPLPASLQLARSRHPAAIAAQERRRIARLAQRTREANEAARRREHRLALEASMHTERGED